MKKLTLAILLFVFANSVSAQNCSNPINNTAFQNGFNQIAIQQTNQKKLEKAELFVNSNCLLAAQVKNIAQLFTEDSYRLEFCEAAYAHTFDQVNFYDVYDAFAAFSFAFRLNDYVHSVNSATVVVQPTNTTTTVVTPPAPTEPAYPNVAYPSSQNYNGKKGCNGPPISDAMFKQIAQNVFIQPTNESKQIAIQNASNSNCMDFAQIMRLVSMLNSEDFRLQMMEYTFPRVYDQEHYQSGIVLFTNTQLQTSWTSFASGYLLPPPPPPPAPVVCEVTATDFAGIMQSIKAKSFPQDKLSLVDLLSKDRCFSVEQIRTIGKEFSFGSDKLTAFKKLYAKCNDKNNYYKLVDELTFSSEKEELNNFIKNGGK
jgi:hypothetical protein